MECITACCTVGAARLPVSCLRPSHPPWLASFVPATPLTSPHLANHLLLTAFAPSHHRLAHCRPLQALDPPCTVALPLEPRRPPHPLHRRLRHLESHLTTSDPFPLGVLVYPILIGLGNFSNRTNRPSPPGQQQTHHIPFRDLSKLSAGIATSRPLAAILPAPLPLFALASSHLQPEIWPSREIPSRTPCDSHTPPSFPRILVPSSESNLRSAAPYPYSAGGGL